VKAGHGIVVSVAEVPMRIVRLALLALVFGSACGTTTTFAPLNASPRPLAARAPDSVEIFQEPPSKAYVVVGTIETQPESAYADTRLTPKLVAAMRGEAARAGCDALLMQGNTPVPADTLGARAVASTSYRAACLVFTSPTAAR
jgi:hypothetical protein